MRGGTRMRRVHGITGLAVLTGALLGWVSFGWAQSRTTKLPQIIGVEVAPTAGAQPTPATLPSRSEGSKHTAAPEPGAAPVPKPELPAPAIKSERPATAQEESATQTTEDPAPTGRQEPSVSLEWSG